MKTRGILLTTLTTFVAALGCSDVGQLADSAEAVGAAGQPILEGTPATEFPEAVLVNIQRFGQTIMGCSGTVIAPSVVLTAGHCVADGNGWEITAPYASGQKSHGSSKAVYDWTQSNDQVSPDQHDVGLVFLDSPISLSSYPTIAGEPLADQAEVITLGRVKTGQLSKLAMYRSKPVKVTSGDSYGFEFDYAATIVIEHGDSGGPSFSMGTHTIVSVNSTGDDTTMLNARVDLLKDWIAKQIEQHGGGSTGGGEGGATAGGGEGGGGPGEPQGAPPGSTCIPWWGTYYCW
jgi:V8-like Glu-specific endopeptidase